MKNFDNVEAIVNELRPGAFFRLGYRTELPVLAEFADEYSIHKQALTTVRTGVSYRSIAPKKEVKADARARKQVYSWVLKNKIKMHMDTGSKYLTVARMQKGGNSISTYVCVNKKDGSIYTFNCDDFMSSPFARMVRSSYFNKTKDGRDNKFFNVRVDNISHIYNSSMEFVRN